MGASRFPTERFTREERQATSTLASIGEYLIKKSNQKLPALCNIYDNLILSLVHIMSSLNFNLLLLRMCFF